MKRTQVAGIVLTCALVIAGCGPAEHARYDRGRSQERGAPPGMTAHDVIKLTRAGISDSVIFTMIGVSGSRFNLRTRDVIALADSGVSHEVIDAMLKADGIPSEADASPGYAYYPPYYWYGGYYSFWNPWYYQWPVIGFRHRNFGFQGGFGRPYRLNGFRGGLRHR
jgi:hypothetical protein